MLTPHKGSSLYDRLKAEGRIVDEAGIGRWPGMKCHIKLKNFSAAELIQRVKGLHRKFYSYRSMLARLPLPLTEAAVASWMINIAERKSFRNEAENFDEF